MWKSVLPITDCENPPEVIPSTAPGGGLPTKHVMVAGMLAVVAPVRLLVAVTVRVSLPP